MCGGCPPSPRGYRPSTWFDPSTLRPFDTLRQARGPSSRHRKLRDRSLKVQPVECVETGEGSCISSEYIRNEEDAAPLRTDESRAVHRRRRTLRPSDSQPGHFDRADTRRKFVFALYSSSLKTLSDLQHSSLPHGEAERPPPPASPPSPLPICRTSLRPGPRPAPTQGSFRSFDRLRTPQAQQTGFARADVGFPPVSLSAANALDSHCQVR